MTPQSANDSIIMSWPDAVAFKSPVISYSQYCPKASSTLSQECVVACHGIHLPKTEPWSAVVAQPKTHPVLHLEKQVMLLGDAYGLTENRYLEHTHL